MYDTYCQYNIFCCISEMDFVLKMAIEKPGIPRQDKKASPDYVRT